MTGRGHSLFAAVAIAVLIGACGDSEGDQARDDWVTGPAATLTTRDPASAFAPSVGLHRREERLPIAADTFVESSTVKWLGGLCQSYETIATGKVARVKAAEDVPLLEVDRLGGKRPYRHRVIPSRCLGQKGSGDPRSSFSATQATRPYDRRNRPPGLPVDQGFYLELLTDAASGEGDVVRDGSRRLFRGVPAYVQRDVERTDGGATERLTYWLLFGRHDPPEGTPGSSHEGDWERLSVLVRRSGRDRYTPISLRYYGRDGARDLPWQAVQRVSGSRGEALRAASHPAVSAARGTHTLHPRGCDDCSHWETWRRLLDAREQPWYGFGGAWGATRGSTTEAYSAGPLGPSPHTTGAETVE